MSTGILVAKDYGRRVADLCEFVEREYGIDQADMRILTSVLLPTPSQPPTRPCWLIADSPRHQFWMDFGKAVETLGYDGIRAVPGVRALRPRKANEVWDEWLGKRNTPRILLDYMYEVPHPYIHPRNRWGEVEAECLRLRVRVNWMKNPPPGTEMELGGLLRLAIDPEHRPFLPVPIPKPPEILIYALGLVMSVNPGLGNPPSTIRNALILPTSHAVLHGRGKLEEQDHRALERVMQNSVRNWDWVVLDALSRSDGQMGVRELQVETLLPPQLLTRVCAKLADSGVVDWPRPWGKGTGQGNRRRWMRLKPGKGDDMRQLVLGSGEGGGRGEGTGVGGGLRWW